MPAKSKSLPKKTQETFIHLKPEDLSQFNDENILFLCANPFARNKVVKISSVNYVKDGKKKFSISPGYSISKFLEVINDEDEESLEKIIKSNLINFLKSPIEHSEMTHDYFSCISPINLDKISSKGISVDQEDIVHMEKKFELLLKMFDLYARFKLFFHAECAMVHFYEFNEDVLNSYCQEQLAKMIEHEKSFRAIKNIFTSGLENYFQEKLYEIELFKNNGTLVLNPAEKERQLEILRRDPAKKIDAEMSLKLKDLQRRFSNFFLYNAETFGSELESSSEIDIRKDLSVFIEECRKKYLLLEEDVVEKLLTPVEGSEKKFDFSVLSTMAIRGKNISQFGIFLMQYIQGIKDSRAPCSFNLPKMVKSMICYGYSDFFKCIPRDQIYKLKDLLLRSDETFLSHNELCESAYQDDGKAKLSLSFDNWLEENYLRLNIHHFFLGSAKDFSTKVCLEYPEGFEKNLWNLALFTRDVEAIRNFPLHLISYHDHSSKENAMELFFYGKYNNLVSEKETFDCLKKLVSFGFGFKQNLKLGSCEDLQKKIEQSLPKKQFDNFAKALEVVGDFEVELMNFVLQKTEASSISSPLIYSKIERFLDIYQAHLQRDPNNIDEVVPKSSLDETDSLVNFLNLTGFLTHLTSTGFIENVNSKTDKASIKLMKKINQLIENLDQNSKIFEEKKMRDSDQFFKELLESETQQQNRKQKGKAKTPENAKGQKGVEKQKLIEVPRQAKIEQNAEEDRMGKAESEKHHQHIMECEQAGHFVGLFLDEVSETMIFEVAKEVLESASSREGFEKLLQEKYFQELQFYQKISRTSKSFTGNYLSKYFVDPYSKEPRVLSSSQMLGEIIKSDENMKIKLQFIDLMSDNLRIMMLICDDKVEFNPLLTHILQIYKFHLDFSSSKDEKNIAIIRDEMLPDFKSRILSKFISGNHENILDSSLNYDQEVFLDLLQNGIKINQNILKKIYEKNNIDLFASIVEKCSNSVGLIDIKEFEEFILQRGQNDRESEVVKEAFLKKINEYKENHCLTSPSLHSNSKETGAVR